MQSKVCTCIHLHMWLNSIPVTHVPPLSHQNTFHFFPQQGHSESPPCSQQQLSVNITSKAVWLVKLSALRHSHADTPHLQKPARRSEGASLVNGLLSSSRAARVVHQKGRNVAISVLDFNFTARVLLVLKYLEMHRVKLLSNSFAPANVTKSVTVCVGIHILPRSCNNHGRCCISC